MQNKKALQKVIIYQAKTGAIEFSVDAGKETIWANLNQIASLFGVQKAAISKHFKNIFNILDGELPSICDPQFYVRLPVFQDNAARVSFP